MRDYHILKADGYWFYFVVLCEPLCKRPMTCNVAGVGKGSLATHCAPTSAVEILLTHRDIAIKTARSLDPGVIDLETNQT